MTRVPKNSGRSEKRHDETRRSCPPARGLDPNLAQVTGESFFYLLRGLRVEGGLSKKKSCWVVVACWRHCNRMINNAAQLPLKPLKRGVEGSRYIVRGGLQAGLSATKVPPAATTWAFHPMPPLLIVFFSFFIPVPILLCSFSPELEWGQSPARPVIDRSTSSALLQSRGEDAFRRGST